ncbi:MAG: hypothetical protein WCI55_11570 [Armatimonadota bacterium]
MLHIDQIVDGFDQYQVHISESPFLKQRKGKYPIKITRGDQPHAKFGDGGYIHSDLSRKAWILTSVVQILRSRYNLFIPDMCFLSAIEKGSQHEMMTCNDMYGKTRLRSRGTEWATLSKLGDRWEIMDEDERILATYQLVTDRPMDQPNLEGIANIDPMCIPDQIDTYLIAFIHVSHGLRI